MVKAIIFDCDGVLYRGEKAVEGAVDAVTGFNRRDYQIFYLTNNSAKSKQEIVTKLDRLGFPTKLQNVYCGSYTLGVYLKEKKFLLVYLIGTDELKNDLISFNIKVKDSSQVAAVVVGLDPGFNYGKISMALEAIRNGAKLIVANTDPSYPVENDRRLPGCGAMVAAIVAATGHSPDFHVGKPNTYMLGLICKEHGLSAAEICVVGDVLESDTRMANNFGCQSILFDPKNTFPEFSGKKVKKLNDLLTEI